MFVFLEESSRKAYDTMPFCLAYLNPTGERSADVHEQKDVDEFMNQFFAAVEEKLQDANENKNLLTDVFGGKLSQQIISKVSLSNIMYKRD